MTGARAITSRSLAITKAGCWSACSSPTRCRTAACLRTSSIWFRPTAPRASAASRNLVVSADMVLTTPGGGSSGGGGGGGGGGGTGGTPQNVVWTGMVNCTASGNSLQKNGGRDDSADAGARSQQALASGDGYLQ